MRVAFSSNGVNHPKVYDLFPKDVVERAKEYREIIGPSGTGAYTHSQGVLGLRKHVAEFIQNRDGYKSYAGNIFLTNGASTAISMVLQGLLASNKDAIMIIVGDIAVHFNVALNPLFYIICNQKFRQHLYRVAYALAKRNSQYAGHIDETTTGE